MVKKTKEEKYLSLCILFVLNKEANLIKGLNKLA
tara:strand:+ start:909 stop:1010 length:102 start_codon:yes stop_codon:yes gene_type:complete